MAVAQAAEQGVAQRIQGEVERAIQRSIKGLEYLASPAPAVGLTQKDIIYRRGTLNLYHYRPLCDDVYRMPLDIGIVGAGATPMRVERIELTERRQTFTIAADSAPASVRLDPNTWMLMEATFLPK